MTNQDQDRFLNTAAGKFFDPDGVYAYQCVDTAIAYAIACFPGVDWKTSFGRNNANGHFPKDNQWFQSIRNVVGDLTSYPQRGDIVIWGGDSFNPYGHIAVVVSADAYSMLVLQQNADGSGQQPTTLARMGYNQPGTGGVVGWLRPKVTGSTPAPKPVPSTTLNGVDISQHQNGINLSATGAQFAIIKASEGVGFTDPAFLANLNEGRRAGIPLGFYHFARPWATPDNTARAEAESFVSVIKPFLGPDDVVILDWEADRIEDTAWAAEFQRIVAELTEKRPWIYMNRNAATTLNWGAAKTAWPLWGAAYPSNSPQGWGPVNHVPDFGGWNLVAWQYSQSGKLAGHGGSVDLNVFYGTAENWRALAAGGTYKPPVIATAPPVTTVSQCVVESGDTLGGIAKQFNVVLGDLIKVNPGINPDLIYPGQVLNLPVKGGPAAQPAAVSKCIVEAGDTLAGIATQFGVDLGALVALNGLRNPNLIFPGQVLALPAKNAAPAPKPVAKPTGHGKWIVDPGDSLSAIGAKYGVTAAAIAAANGLSNPDLIYPGQVLNIP
jgi:LysM repeat protein/GH25 family lysozyme M1 (1,4-beta-N-acetylmuramidase)